jgi:uncharacterized protein involved in exopolysaccharide biosynthesis
MEPSTQRPSALDNGYRYSTPPSLLPEDEVVSPLRLLNVLLGHWRLVLGLPLLLAAIVLVVGLLQPRTYTATGSFVPQGGEGAESRISSIAAQIGLDVGSGGNTAQSPAFYRTLLLSDEILNVVARTEYTVRIDGRVVKAKLPTLLEIEEETPGRELRATVEALRERVSVRVDRETGVVEIAARAEWPELALQIVERMSSLVAEFNLRKRQEQAAAERAFIQERVDDARSRLRGAEDALQRFLQSNRLYQGDPQLVFTFERLRREVDSRQSVYTTLAQAYERTALNALRDTPVTTTVQRPELPPVPDRRGLGLKLVLALVVGAFLATLFAFAREYFASTRERNPDEYAKYLAQRAQIRAVFARSARA